MQFIRNHKFEIAIFLLAFALRFLYLAISLDYRDGNLINTIAGADGYYSISQNILAGHGFSSAGNPPYVLNSYRPPMMPYFIAWMYMIFGSYWAVIIIYMILSSLLAILAIRISEFLTKSEAVSALVGMFIAIEPYTIVFSTIFYGETLFMFFFFLSILFLFKYLKGNMLSRLLLSAFFLGTATLTKPVVQYLPIIAMAIMIWNIKKKSLPSYVPIALYGLVFLVTISPWVYRNYKEFNIIGISSQANVQIYEMLVPSTLAIENDTSWGEEYHKLLNSGTGVIDVNASNIKDTDDYLKRAIPVLLAHPAALIVLSANTALNFFIHDGMYDVLRRIGLSPKVSLRKPALFLLLTSPKEIFSEIIDRTTKPEILILVGRVLWTIITIASFAGVALYIKKGLTPYALVAILTTGYFMLTALSIGLAVNARYRLPVNLFIIFFALYALLIFWKPSDSIRSYKINQ
ncbi:MAG: glycosyltransferase family 39 protein [Candidatus Vogelbacteria bacterium]|nr:glycosyltransferase family 39 protein [Candidatus Vogelbacteria bacterium]